nr:hypothetical protein [Streptomyces lydicus]
MPAPRFWDPDGTNCRIDAGYCIPRSLGMCVPCAFPDDERRAA